MKFVIQQASERDKNSSYIQESKIKEKYLPDKKVHLFYYLEDNEEKSICSINAETGKMCITKFDIIPPLDKATIHPKEVLQVIHGFLKDTKQVNGDIDSLKDFLISKMSENKYGGFAMEFFISITGENFNPEKCWWTVHRMRSFCDGNIGMPVFAIRYTLDEDSEGYNTYGEPGTPQDLYIGGDNNFDVKTIAEAIASDIERICKKVYDITVIFQFRL